MFSIALNSLKFKSNLMLKFIIKQTFLFSIFIEDLCIFALQFWEMKKGIHPENYRTVVFKDMSNDYSFLSRSTANTKETIKWEDANSSVLSRKLLSVIYKTGAMSNRVLPPK